MTAEASARIHDSLIVAHNHSARLRLVARRERARPSAEAHLLARWTRVLRRWSAKHRGDSNTLADFYSSMPTQGGAGLYMNADDAPDSDALHDTARRDWYGPLDERSRLGGATEEGDR